MKHLALVIALAIVATACTTTTEPTNTGKVYAPSATGTYVIHQNTDILIDDDGNTTNTRVLDDSTVVVGTESKTDDAGVTKTAIRHVVFVSGEATDTLYIAEEGGVMYAFLELGVSDIGPAPINIGNRWVVLGDQSKTSWTALEENFTGIDIEFQGSTIPADINIKVSGENKGNENMTINGTTVSTIKYDQTVAITMKVTIAPPPVSAIEIPISITTSTWFGENIGMVRTEQDARLINATLATIPIDGYISTAIRYGKK